MMRKNRNTILWMAAAIAVAALSCWLLLYRGSFFHPGKLTDVNLSSTEALSIFERKADEFRGPARLDLRQAIKDAAYLRMRLRLFLGAKLDPLVTTNASASELAAAFAIYSICRGVIIPGEPQEMSAMKTVKIESSRIERSRNVVIVPGEPREMPARRFGAFDSGNYPTRWRAAAAIVKLLGDAGWRVARLTDGKVVFLSQIDYDLLLAAKSPALQGKLLQKFDHAKDLSEKHSPAQILSRLWHAGFLGDQIKEQLAEEHYHLVLRQLPSNGYPSWDVRCEQTFPFPDIWTDFTPTLYRNDQVKWSPGRPQRSCAMMNAIFNPITSMSGGEFKNGDVLRCKIEMAQKVDGQLWKINLWTDKIVLQGLKD